MEELKNNKFQSLKQEIKSLTGDINQIAGDSISFNYNSTNIETPSCGVINELNTDIYFTYGDSDVQSLFIKRKYSEAEYYDFMAKAFKLLLAFKPSTSIIVISASSVIESNLTRRLVQDYKCFSGSSEAHFGVLIRESTLQDYIDKRQSNTKKLIHIEKYSMFYNNEIVNSLKDISVIRKRPNSGSETSLNWVEKAEIIIPQIDPAAARIEIKNLPYEILKVKKSIFVWEEIKEKLIEKGINIPSRDDQLQCALVESYLSIFAETYIFPYGEDSLSLNLTKSSSYFTNIKLLEKLFNADILMEFLKLTPSQLLSFINSENFLYFKIKLISAKNETERLLIARKDQELLKKALVQSKDVPIKRIYTVNSKILNFLFQNIRQ